MQVLLKLLPRLSSLAALAFFMIAILLIHHQMQAYHMGRIRALIVSIPAAILAKAAVLTICAYLAVILYDKLALDYIGRKIAIGRIMLAAFVSFTVTHNVGHSLIAGTSIRYRFYSRWAISGMEIVQISLVNSITYALGIISVLLVAYAVNYSLFKILNIQSVNWIIPLFFITLVAYAVCVAWWKPLLLIKGVHFRLPTLRLTVMQLAAGCADILLAGMVLHTLLSATLSIPLGEFFVFYVLSLLLGIFSQIPGGLGVFEGLFLHFLSSRYPSADILASLVLYRMIYYFLPLILAGLLLLAYEIGEHKNGSRLLNKKAIIPDPPLPATLQGIYKK